MINEVTIVKTNLTKNDKKEIYNIYTQFVMKSKLLIYKLLYIGFYYLENMFNY